MIREHLAEMIPGEKHFRWRGTDITRLEGLSDAVFAFAVTLLVVSLEVPKSYQELMLTMHGFIAFGICFALLAELWTEHARFFRRYGLQDAWSVFLNCVLLFLVLFYVYPLKFLFFAMFAENEQMNLAQVRSLFVLYGAGYAAVFVVFVLLYLHAWKMRDRLALNEIERLRTYRSLINHSAMVAVGLVSLLLAVMLPPRFVTLAGWFYFSLAAYYTIAGTIFGKRERLALEDTKAAAAAVTTPAD